MTLEDAQAQLNEMKRLADLKAKQEKSEQRADPLPITKISYKVDSSKQASIRITRGNNPLSLTVYDKFIINMSGFTEWLKLHALASISNTKANNLLLKILKAKFLWLKSQAGKLGLTPPPPELCAFDLCAPKKKRKRASEILEEVFVKEDIRVDGMHRNGIEGNRGLVIREPEPRIFFYNGNFDLVFQREEEFHLATTAQLIRLQNAIQRGSPEAEEIFAKLDLTIKARNDVTEARKTSTIIEGLAVCKDLASNLRRIQVKDIVNEVEDHLKTYSSAGMDISWYVEGIRWGFKDNQRWQYSDYPVC
ncbi:hypothetical protein Tco_1005218 [Tanacetum coccineum]|uniref:Uncharacterized protein n=1 Tax=Tanacetum coccineum TaxID=301880 RepID=A0ABQ5FEF4_9ASTR